MKENDELSRLLKDRLSGAEMDVRPGFWEGLQGDLDAAAERRTALRRHRSIGLRRVAAAATVAAVLGIATLLVWQLPRQEDIQDVLTQTPPQDLVAPIAPFTESSVTTTLPTTHLAADASATPSPISAAPMPARQPRTQVQGTPTGLGLPGTGATDEANGAKAATTTGAVSSWLPYSLVSHSGGWPYSTVKENDEGDVTVTITVTITERLQARDQQSYGYSDFAIRHGYAYPWLPPTLLASQGEGTHSPSAATADTGHTTSSARRTDAQRSPEGGEDGEHSPWSWRIAVGTALPRGDYHAPLTVEVAIQRELGSLLALNLGLQYHYLGTSADPSSDATSLTPADLHLLSIPVRLQARLLASSRLTLYAHAGGAVEKSLGKGWHEDPIRLSVAAGLGISYQMGDRLALFAEPSVTHHFDTDTQVRSLRTERPTNVGLLCGLRMIY